MPATTRDLRFSAEDGTTLVGSLRFPESSTGVTAVVALHSASEGVRSEPIYEHLADTISLAGIAVFTFDRRGEGESGGRAGVSLRVLASDARCAVAAVAAEPEIDGSKVGVWGLSQGGWVGPMAAADFPEIAFVIAASSSGVSPSKQMHFGMENVLRERGFSERDIGRAHKVRSTFEDLYARGDRAAAAEVLGGAEAESWFRWAFLPTSADIEQEATEERFELDLDVADVISRLRVPTLLIYGERDRWVPIEESIRVWRSDFGGDPASLTLERIPGVGHMLTLSDPADLGEAGPFSPDLDRILTSWLRDAVS